MRPRHLLVPLVALGLLNCSTRSDVEPERAPLTEVASRVSSAGGDSTPIAFAPSNAGVRFFAERTVLRPSFTASRTPLSARADVLLPKVASNPFSLRSATSGMGLSVATVGAGAVGAREDAGIVHYEGAFGSGTDAFHRVTPGGTEDFVRFEQAPSVPELTYRVELQEGVAGLRKIGNVLEFLDSGGTPRLHVSSPYGIDAHGKRFGATLALRGCVADESPAAPWGRAVTPPGSDTCTVSVSWPSDVAYPATIDPAWHASSDLPNPGDGSGIGLVTLSGGRVLALTADGASLFNSTNDTWAATGAPPADVLALLAGDFQPRAFEALSGDRAILAFTNYGGPPPAPTLYSLATGTWSVGKVFPADSSSQVAAADLGGNKVLFITTGGKTYVYDVVAKTFLAKTAANFPAPIAGSALGAPLKIAKVSASKFLVAAPQGFRSPTPTFKTYDFVADVWGLDAAQPPPNVNMYGPGELALLPNGNVYFYTPVYDATRPAKAGIYKSGTAVAIDERLLPTTPAMVDFQLWGHGWAQVPGGLLFNGGSFLLDQATGAVTRAPAFLSGMGYHTTLAKLPDGRVLAAGGTDPAAGTPSPLTDIYGPSNSAECLAFGDKSRPTFDPTTNRCVACDGNFGGGSRAACPTSAAPICQLGAANPLAGQCTTCSATNTSGCSATTPTCDTATGTCARCNGGNGSTATRACPAATSPVCKTDGSCAPANGDNGSTASQPCPTAANPFMKPDGTCGKCGANADCAGTAHTGPICVAGACGTTCTSSTDCTSTQFCDATARACLPKKDPGAGCTSATECASASCTAGKCDTSCTSQADCPATAYCAISASPKICKAKLADGAPCTSKDECVSAACTSGKCGAGTPAPDGGPDGGGKEPPPDGGTTNAPDSGSTGPVGGADAGANAEDQPDGQSVEGGGCGCKTAGPSVGSAWSLALFLGSVFGLARRRRRR